MVRVVVSEKNPIDIVVGDSQMQKLFQGSIAEINQSIDALFLNEHAGRIAFQRGHCGTGTQYGNIHKSSTRRGASSRDIFP